MPTSFKPSLLTFLLSLISCIAYANNDTSEFTLRWGGFIKNDIILDTRKNQEALDGLFLFYPLPPDFDLRGNDLNKNLSVSFLSLSSRLGLSTSGVRFLNGKASGHMELDFTNFTNIAGVRFRHAYSVIEWGNTSLLFGLYWHPLFVTDVFPTVISFNTGAPFQVFNRSPQIKFSHKAGNLRLTASAIYQSDFKSPGPNGPSAEYLRNAVLSNLNLALQWETPGWLLGLTGDYKRIQPRLYKSPLVGPDAGKKFRTDEKLDSWAVCGYFKFAENNLTIKAKSMLGQNLFEHFLPGGYAVAAIDSLTGAKEYSGYNHLFLWGNIVYGRQLRAGLFAGYFKNLGTSANITGPLFARGENIDYAYRISTFVSYREQNISLSLEAETTVAAYGTIDFGNKARVIDSSETAGTRFTLSLVYHL